MPLYEYKCGCGNKFETIRSIAQRHDVKCPCGNVPKLMISSWGRVLVAAWDTVVGSNGEVLSRKQSTGDIPMLPEKVHGSRF